MRDRRLATTRRLRARDPPPRSRSSLGYRHDRWFWLMRRERGAAPPEPVWPAGVTVRVFDSSDAMLADYERGVQRLVRRPLPLHADLARAALARHEEARVPRRRRAAGLPRRQPVAFLSQRAVLPRAARSPRSARRTRRAASGSGARCCAGASAGSSASPRSPDARCSWTARTKRAGALSLRGLRGLAHAPDLGAAGAPREHRSTAARDGRARPYQAPGPASPDPVVKDRFRAFLVLWGSQTLSLFGTMVSQFAINVWLARDLYPLAAQKPQLALALTATGLRHHRAADLRHADRGRVRRPARPPAHPRSDRTPRCALLSLVLVPLTAEPAPGAPGRRAAAARLLARQLVPQRGVRQLVRPLRGAAPACRARAA